MASTGPDGMVKLMSLARLLHALFQKGAASERGRKIFAAWDRVIALRIDGSGGTDLVARMRHGVCSPFVAQADARPDIRLLVEAESLHHMREDGSAVMRMLLTRKIRLWGRVTDLFVFSQLMDAGAHAPVVVVGEEHMGGLRGGGESF